MVVAHLQPDWEECVHFVPFLFLEYDWPRKFPLGHDNMLNASRNSYLWSVNSVLHAGRLLTHCLKQRDLDYQSCFRSSDRWWHESGVSILILPVQGLFWLFIIFQHWIVFCECGMSKSNHVLWLTYLLKYYEYCLILFIFRSLSIFATHCHSDILVTLHIWHTMIHASHLVLKLRLISYLHSFLHC